MPREVGRDAEAAPAAGARVGWRRGGEGGGGGRGRSARAGAGRAGPGRGIRTFLPRVDKEMLQGQ